MQRLVYNKCDKMRKKCITEAYESELYGKYYIKVWEISEYIKLPDHSRARLFRSLRAYKL